MQADLFDYLSPPPPALPQVPDDDPELTEALDLLSQGCWYHVIRTPIPASAGALLQKLRAEPVITQKDIRAFGQSGSSNDHFADMMKRHVIFYESHKNPIRIGIHRNRVIALAKEMDGRIEAHARAEAGLPPLAAPAEQWQA